MPLNSSLVQGLRLTANALGVAALLRLHITGLRKHFNVLFWFLFFSVARDLALFAASRLPHPQRNYAWLWVQTEPIAWLFYILLALDVHSLILRDYAGLRTVGRWIFLVALPVAIFASGLTILPFWNGPNGNATLFYYAIIDRGIMFSLVVFILLALFLLSRFPISLSRNMVVHVGVCATFLISAGMAYFVRTVEGDSVTHAMNLVNEVITVLCWGAWLFLLTPKGQETPAPIHRRFTPEDEERLIDQLTSINTSLLRAARK